MMEFINPSYLVVLCFLLGALCLWLNKVSFRLSGFAAILGSFAVLLGQFALKGVGPLSYLFALMCSTIGLLVVGYSWAYFKKQPDRFGQFSLFLFAFFGSMLGLLYSKDLINLFIYWEMTSLTSFLLVGFNNGSNKAREAARTALIITGGGGLCLLAGLILLGIENGTYEIAKLTSGSTPAAILVLLGIFTKSAQFPFHFWLPKAMKAPTPASAFLHSAAMVKAGPYLIILLAPIFWTNEFWSIGLKSIGLISGLVGGYMAITKRDLKAILAGLTISALGIMCVMGSVYNHAALKAFLVFLMAHSLYKSILFMGAGILDKQFGDRDVFRLSGALREYKPLLVIFVIGLGSMIGLFPFMGFVAKELVLKSIEGHWLLFPVCLVFLFYGVAAIRILYPLISKKPKKVVKKLKFSFYCAPLIGAATTLIFGIFPGFLNKLVEDSLGEVGVAQKVDLHLWHGLTTAFILSVAIILCSLLISWFMALKKYPEQSGVSETLYDAFWRNVRAYSGKTVSAWHRSGTSLYLYIFFGFALLLVGGMFFTYWRPVVPNVTQAPTYYEWSTGLLVAGGAILALMAKNIFIGVVGLGLSGYGMALLFIMFSSPDLALTQFLVETMTVILVCFIFIRFPTKVPRRGTKRTLVNLAVSLGVGALSIGIMWKVLSYPFSSAAAEYYLKNAYELGHGKNVVNVAIVDFRAFDTLGEAFVVFLAGVGVASLFRLMPGYNKDRGK